MGNLKVQPRNLTEILDLTIQPGNWMTFDYFGSLNYGSSSFFYQEDSIRIDTFTHKKNNKTSKLRSFEVLIERKRYFKKIMNIRKESCSDLGFSVKLCRMSEARVIIFYAGPHFLFF